MLCYCIFHDDRQFHAAIGWLVGDLTAGMEEPEAFSISGLPPFVLLRIIQGKKGAELKGRRDEVEGDRPAPNPPPDLDIHPHRLVRVR